MAAPAASNSPNFTDGNYTKKSEKVLLRRPRPARKAGNAVASTKTADQNLNNLETPPASPNRDGAKDRSTFTSASSKLPRISRQDKKWVLDSAYQSRQTTSYSNNGRILLHPRKPKGPDPLAPREVRKQANLLSEFLRSDEDIRYSKPPLFTLNDFTLRVAEENKISVSDVHKIILSSANYKRITEAVAQKLKNNYNHISFVDVDLDALDEIEDQQQRVPPGQLLFEMAALIKQEVKASLNLEVECKVKKLPKFSPGYRMGEAPHSEIVLFERQRAQELDRIVQKDALTGHPTHESLFAAGALRKQFQQNARSASPFTYEEDSQISPAEICVLDCLLTGGIALSLKANFIAELPDISVLRRTLTYVNLSYNNFKEIPDEILDLPALQILKLRNNPIASLPAEIQQLQRLESLIVSFCLVSFVPVNLYSLTRLRILDLSYNRISFLHKEIKNLRSLAYLNLEGNELSSLPNSMLRMRLRRIKLRNNFLHPLLWQENSVNQPQQLQDLAAVAFYHCGLNRRFRLQAAAQSDEHTMPEDIRQMLVQQLGSCECCGGPSFGNGLRLIRPARRLFGVRYLPLLFTACSPHCRSTFLKADAEIAERLYQSDGEAAADDEADEEDEGDGDGEVAGAEESARSEDS